MKVYDVFGMIPPPSEQDGADVHERYAKIAARRGKGRRRRHLLRVPRRPLRRGDRVLQSPGSAGRRPQRRAGPRAVRGHDRPPRARGRQPVGRGGAQARLDTALDRLRPRLADRARPRPEDVRGDGLRSSGRRPRLGQHRRPHPEHRLARPPGPPPGRATPWTGRPRGPARTAARAHPAGAAPDRRRRGSRADHRAPRRLDVRSDPRGHVGAVLRLVHARAVRHPPRLPAAPQPASGLRLLPLQQARPAHARGGRVPAPLRPGRLPRLEHRPPAALARRPGLLLGLRDDDDRHRVPGPRAATARRAARLRRRRGGARGRSGLRAQRRGRPHTPVRGQRRPRARAARDLPRRAPRGGHLAPPLLPAGPVDRRRRRVPAQEPLGHPLRRPRRARRRRLRGHAREHRRQARAGLPRDPLRPPGGRGVRAVARAHRRRGRGGRAAPPRGRRAGAGGDRSRAPVRGRAGEDRHDRRFRRRGRPLRGRDAPGRRGRHVGADRLAARARLAPAARVDHRPAGQRQGRGAARRALPRGRRSPGCGSAGWGRAC